jgi:hypothetical protein
MLLAQALPILFLALREIPVRFTPCAQFIVVSRND